MVLKRKHLYLEEKRCRGDIVLKSENINHDFVSETERLIIRLLDEQDYKRWLEGFNNNYPPQHKYDDDHLDISEWTEDAFQNVVKKHRELAADDRAYVFGIFRKMDGQHIGKVEFSTIMRGEFQWGMIGYRLHNQFWRYGYGKEAVKEGLNIAFSHLHFHRIEAHINVDNIPSINLAESIGMEFECTRKGFIFEFGEWTDNLVYYKNAK